MPDEATGRKIALIAGAGPAGLTAAYELLQRTDILPVILEKSNDIGGISRTVRYKGNRIDIGGHRFFSKSQRVMDWWLNILPQETPEDPPGQAGGRMLVRNRLSRIYFLRRFFQYPVTLSADTLKKLGILRSAAIFLSYLRIRLHPLPEERSLEDFLINRFGRTLYRTFFKAYTEKVWGIPCREISPEWGAQRIKGLSIARALQHAFRQFFRYKDGNVRQQHTETSLIDKFLYPCHGPGELWEEVARQIREMGGAILMGQEVMGISTGGRYVTGLSVKDSSTGATRSMHCDYFFSTMPVKEFVQRLSPALPQPFSEIADGLMYRDFITVGLLLRRVKEGKPSGHRKYDLGTIRDNWIYIQEEEVKVGRLQVFNNWSSFMVASPKDTVWVGMEYFCQEGDALWCTKDDEMIRFAAAELAKIGLIAEEDVLDGTVIRVEKAYPAYFGSYARFDDLREQLSHFDNLFLIGRNGMHKYNNADHSMLTAMTAVDNIVAGRCDTDNIWSVNTERSYHEAKS